MPRESRSSWLAIIDSNVPDSLPSSRRRSAETQDPKIQKDRPWREASARKYSFWRRDRHDCAQCISEYNDRSHVQWRFLAGSANQKFLCIFINKSAINDVGNRDSPLTTMAAFSGESRSGAVVKFVNPIGGCSQIKRIYQSDSGFLQQLRGSFLRWTQLRRRPLAATDAWSFSPGPTNRRARRSSRPISDVVANSRPRAGRPLRERLSSADSRRWSSIPRSSGVYLRSPSRRRTDWSVDPRRSARDRVPRNRDAAPRSLAPRPFAGDARWSEWCRRGA